MTEHQSNQPDTEAEQISISGAELARHRLPHPVPITYEDGKCLNAHPAIYQFDDFMSQAEVFQLLHAARGQLVRAKVSGENELVTSAGRTGSHCWLEHKHNKVIHGLSKRISRIVGIDLAYAEPLQVIYYGDAQEYRAHFDTWEEDSPAGRQALAVGGQRIVTCLLYLNDVEAGGGTGFPQLDLTVGARKGRMLVFHNCFHGTSLRHPLSLHGGLPVEQGEKFAVNLWFHARNYQQERKQALAQRKR